MMRASKKDQENIMQMYKDGAKIREIFAAFSFSYSTIKKIIYSSKDLEKRNPHPGLGRPKKEMATEAPPFTVPEEKLNRVLILTNFGYTPKEIAEDLALNHGKVSQLVHYLKVTKKICKRV